MQPRECLSDGSDCGCSLCPEAKDKDEIFNKEHPYEVQIFLVDPMGGKTIQHYLIMPDRLAGIDAVEAAFDAASEFEAGR